MVPLKFWDKLPFGIPPKVSKFSIKGMVKNPQCRHKEYEPSPLRKKTIKASQNSVIILHMLQDIRAEDGIHGHREVS